MPRSAARMDRATSISANSDSKTPIELSSCSEWSQCLINAAGSTGKVGSL